VDRPSPRARRPRTTYEPGSTVFGISGRSGLDTLALGQRRHPVRELDYHDTFLAAEELLAPEFDNIPPILAVAQHMGCTAPTGARNCDRLRDQSIIVKAINLHAHKIGTSPYSARRPPPEHRLCLFHLSPEVILPIPIGRALAPPPPPARSRRGRISPGGMHPPS
jgi:hypothetical protein